MESWSPHEEEKPPSGGTGEREGDNQNLQERPSSVLSVSTSINPTPNAPPSTNTPTSFTFFRPAAQTMERKHRKKLVAKCEEFLKTKIMEQNSASSKTQSFPSPILPRHFFPRGLSARSNHTSSLPPPPSPPNYRQQTDRHQLVSF